MVSVFTENVEQQVLFEKKDHIATITFNRPESRNAITLAGQDRFYQLMKDIAKDSDIHVVVLRGAGDKAFCVGHDLKEDSVNPIITDINERRADTRYESDINLSIWDLPQPVISSVSGYCIGMGLCMVMTSDLVIAADNAKFGETQLALGFAPNYCINPWKMGLNHAKEMSLLGTLFSAEDMYRFGVVNRVVSYEELEKTTYEIARRIAELNFNAIKTVKYDYNKTYEMMNFKSAINFCGEVYNMHR